MSHNDPFSEPPGLATSKPNESDDLAQFALRPLRILKRTENSTPQRSVSGSSDDFVLRPMRLSGPSVSVRPESRDITPNQRLRSRRGSTQERYSISERLSKDLATPSGLPRNLRRSSIQIKNLPIVQSPRRSSSVDLSKLDKMIFAVCLVDFHHVRGPEVQWWLSNYHGEYDQNDALFRNLPFQALPDGSHLFEETFSNFNLVYDFQNGVSLDNLEDIENFRGNPNHLETLFGCSCVRQVKTSDMSQEELDRNKEITRSIVQKAVVVITRKQPIFTKIKEKLSIITHSYFQQSTFTNFDLLQSLFDNLNDAFKLVEEDHSLKPLYPDEVVLLENQKNEKQEEFFVNLNLRHILSQVRGSMLVILKALLLEKKVVIYSNNNLELLTQFQNNLIALVPDLLNNLELSGCPLSDYSEKYSPLTKPNSLKTNDRQSMLRFFGLPLQIFNTKGSFWNPYLALQQLDELTAETYMVGCSNLLIANQLALFKVDLMVNLDTCELSYPVGKPDDLLLSLYDRRFISALNATEQTGESYIGSDDYIRYQFEDYIRSLLATARFQQYMERFKTPPPGFDVVANKHMGALKDFDENFVLSWQQTHNYKIWDAVCDEFIFNFHEPVHIAVTMPESLYNLGSFFTSFKKVPPPTTTLVDKANQYFSHAQKPQKYISDGESTATEDSKQGSKSGWWGFKK